MRHDVLNTTAFLLFLLAVLRSDGQLDDWNHRVSQFKKALSGNDTTQIESAAEGIAQDNSERAAKLFIESLNVQDRKTYWTLISCLSKIDSAEGVDCLTKTILSNRASTETKRDLLYSLQLNPSIQADNALLTVVEKGTSELQVAAIDELVKREKTELIQPLINVLKKEDKKGSELRRQAEKALQLLTQQACTTTVDWQVWWDKNKDGFKVSSGNNNPSPNTGETIADTLKINRKTGFEELKTANNEEILVVEGFYDKIENALTSLSIPHKVINLSTLETTDLSKCKVLLINCDGDFTDPQNPSKSHTYTHPSAAILGKIQSFVAKGGYLFTEDYGVDYFLEGAFPGYVHFNNSDPTAQTTDKQDITVSIFPRKGMNGHPYLKDVFTKDKMAQQWVIDSDSYLLDYDPSKVTVLIESPDLEKQHKRAAVVVTFSVGDNAGNTLQDLTKQKGGRVLHILSHFSGNNAKDGQFVLQNLLLNFIMEKHERDNLKKGK